MTTISKLTDNILEFRNVRNWQKYHTPKNLSLSLVIEMGELFELIQWQKDEEILTELDRIKPQLADELADITIYLFLLAHELKIDLEKAIPNKLEKNNKKYPIDSLTDEKVKWGRSQKSAD